MLCVDDVLIIFEGVNRLRWSREPTWESPQSPPARIVHGIWPDRTSQTTIRRKIDHGHRVVVVLDGKSSVVVLPRKSVPSLPKGALEIVDKDSSQRIFSIPLLNWLNPADRARGENFLAEAESTLVGQSPTFVPKLLLEDSLIGSPLPLRFVYQTAPLAIDTLRSSIQRMYYPRCSATLDVLTENSPQFLAKHRQIVPRAAA